MGLKVDRGPANLHLQKFGTNGFRKHGEMLVGQHSDPDPLIGDERNDGADPVQRAVLLDNSMPEEIEAIATKRGDRIFVP